MLCGWCGDFEIEYSFLHELEDVLAFVVLVERLDDLVDAGGIVEDIVFADFLSLLVVDECQYILKVFRSDHPILLH